MCVTDSIAEAILIGHRILLLLPNPGEVKAEVSDLEAIADDPAAAAELEHEIHGLLFNQEEAHTS